VAGAAAVALAVVLFAGSRPSEIPRRWRFLTRTAPLEPARRRLAGSSTAFDRAYFEFLESARRALPPGTAGVALFLPARSEPAIYLAAYDLAPLPVLFSPIAPPGEWTGAAYSVEPPPGWTVVQEVPGGLLLRRTPAEGVAR
jgi:hypothetical protein